jgi:4a-hydroxytetrahydrobiopterin dehydratase
LRAWVKVRSLEQACDVATTAVAVCGDEADGHLYIDLRPDGVELSLQDRARGDVTARDAELARRIADALDGFGLTTAQATAVEAGRPVQMLEMAIDAMDIPAIRPFWKAVMAYADEPRNGYDPGAALVDPAGQMATIWFQQMDAPRPQRNRIHFDITVAHDEADARVLSAIAAGGHLVNDAFAPSFWVLADDEGNEVCVCSWKGRDERDG